MNGPKKMQRLTWERMAYIDSELAKLRRGSSDAAASSPDGTATGEVTSRPARTGFPSRQPATLGKLHEIDLGPAVKLTNIAKTEAAKKRIAAGHEEEEDLVGRSTKPRVGKDGKPWRGRRARTSEDVQRDKLVEEVLRETRRTPVPGPVHGDRLLTDPPSHSRDIRRTRARAQRRRRPSGRRPHRGEVPS